MKEVITQKMQKLSGQMLYKLGHATETHEAVCYALGIRTRVRDFSNINSLKWELRHEGFKIVEADYMQMWKDWQSAGLGVILLGRGKKQNKFIHYYDMRMIAQAAIEGKDVEVIARNNDQKAIIEEANTMQLNRIASSINKSLAEATASPEIVKAIAEFDKDKKEDATPVPVATPPKVTAKPKPVAAPKVVNKPVVNKPTAPVAPATAKKVAGANGVKHVFISLRPTFCLDIKLPEDVTVAELELIREVLNRASASKAA